VRIDRVLALRSRQALFVLFQLVDGRRGPAMIADDVAVACMMSGEMSTDRMLIRQECVIVRGHVQRDEQQLDHISHRPRTRSLQFGRSVVGVWAGVLRRRPDVRCGLIVCLPCGHDKRSLFCC
jgi:hypothetical protein